MDNFNLLPVKILSDILIRLPAESVLDCKLVSKTWRNLIQHPLFSKMHTNRLINHSAPAYSTDSSGKLCFFSLAADKQLYYIEYVENNETLLYKIERINLTPPVKCDTLVGSFNGLICLRGRKESFCIYNPMTKEYSILPEPKIKFSKHKHRWNGFGYVPSTNEYKVVVMYKVPKLVEVMVYTLGSGNGWRNIGKFSLKKNYVFEGYGISANGALHWMHRQRKMILVFDLAEENFREHLSTPPLPTSCWSLGLGVLGEVLFCADRYFVTKDSHYDIWQYKQKNDNDDKEEKDEHQALGWSLEFTVNIRPLAFTENGDILGYGSKYLDIYDPKTEFQKEIVECNEQFCQVFPHNNTFVSLKELGEEGKILAQSVKTKKRKGGDWAN